MDFHKIKKDFPIFEKKPELIFLDSASTTLKPRVVVDALVEYYEQYSANIKRGVYKISEKATEEYEKTRDIVAEFIGADREEVIFTRNTTESINLVMYALGTNIVSKGDEIVVGIENHHSHFVPWQQLALNTGAILKVLDPITHFNVSLHHSVLGGAITKRTKILALTHVSNVLGTVNPVKEIISAVRRINPKIITVIDGAQAVPHTIVNVKELGCDFYAFSGHKMLGPTGVGVLWGRKNLLQEMVPFLYGGEMIRAVHLDHTEFADLPEKYEAGTPAIAEVIALKHAVTYLTKVGLKAIRTHEVELAQKTKKLLEGEFRNHITFYGPNIPQSGIVSFNMNGVHAHDLASLLDKDGICIRAGHHCTMPLHSQLGISSSARASFYLYNNDEEIDYFVKSLQKAFSLFKKH